MSFPAKKVRVEFEIETKDVISMVALLEQNFKMRKFQYEVLES